jgi:hypothetical protein
MTTHRPARPSEAGHALNANITKAWIAVAAIPLAFILAFAVGEGLYALLGYEPGDRNEPLWVTLTAAAPALAVFLLPCAAAVRFGRRAWSDGHRSALAPVAIGAALGLWMLVISAATLVAG